MVDEHYSEDFLKGQRDGSLPSQSQSKRVCDRADAAILDFTCNYGYFLRGLK